MMSYKLVEDFECSNDSCGFGIRVKNSKYLISEGEEIKKKDYEKQICLLKLKRILDFNRNTEEWKTGRWEKSEDLTILNFDCLFCDNMIEDSGIYFEKTNEDRGNLLLLHHYCLEDFRRFINEIIDENKRELVGSKI